MYITSSIASGISVSSIFLFYSHIRHKILSQRFIVYCLESDTQSVFVRYVVDISATLAALHPTVRLSPWRRVWKISTSGCGPMVSPNLYSTQEGPWPHPGSPQVLVTRAYGPHPLETEWDKCPEWLPLVPLYLAVPPGEVHSQSPSPQILSASLPPKCFSIYYLLRYFSVRFTAKNCTECKSFY